MMALVMSAVLIPASIPDQPSQFRCFQPKTKYQLRAETAYGPESGSYLMDAHENRRVIRDEAVVKIRNLPEPKFVIAPGLIDLFG